MNLDREQVRAIIFFDWKKGLTRDQCFEEMNTYLDPSVHFFEALITS